MADIPKEDLEKEIAAILKGVDLTMISAKMVRKMVEEKFDTDLTSRKKEVYAITLRCVKEIKRGAKKNVSEKNDDDEISNEGSVSEDDEGSAYENEEEGDDHSHEEGDDHSHEEGDDHSHEEGDDHSHEEGDDHSHEEGDDHSHEEGDDHSHEEGDDHSHEEGDDHSHEEGDDHSHEEGDDHSHEEGDDHSHEEGDDHSHEEGDDHSHEEGDDHSHEEGDDHSHEEGDDHSHEEGDDHENEEEAEEGIKTPKRGATPQKGTTAKREITSSDESDGLSQDRNYRGSHSKKRKGKARTTKGRKKGPNYDSDEDWSLKKKSPAKKRCGKNRGGGGYNKPCKLSPELATVVGTDALPRHQVVKKVWSIIKDQNLFDPENKHYAYCNESLMKVIGVKRFPTYDMMKYLKKHIIDQ